MEAKQRPLYLIETALSPAARAPADVTERRASA
jgi:hypothetical protein